MTCQTIMLLLTNSTSAIDDNEMKIVMKSLEITDEKNYFVSIQNCNNNKICHYLTSIIILKRSIKEAEPIATLIIDSLKKNGISDIKTDNTDLIWDDTYGLLLLLSDSIDQHPAESISKSHPSEPIE